MSKRVFDLAAATAGLIVTAPLLCFIALAVRVTSGGPVLFRQQRVGLGQAPFICIKFRTLRTDTPSVPTHELPAGSTPALGAFLRRWKLDELPQLWNVLKGEMSLVGPRPCLPSQNELIAQRQKRDVFSVRPGVTGLAQVSGVDMADPVRCAELDAQYVATIGLGTDTVILARTFLPG